MVDSDRLDMHSRIWYYNDVLKLCWYNVMWYVFILCYDCYDIIITLMLLIMLLYLWCYLKWVVVDNIYMWWYDKWFRCDYMINDICTCFWLWQCIMIWIMYDK